MTCCSCSFSSTYFVFVHRPLFPIHSVWNFCSRSHTLRHTFTHPRIHTYTLRFSSHFSDCQILYPILTAINDKRYDAAIKPSRLHITVAIKTMILSTTSIFIVVIVVVVVYDSYSSVVAGCFSTIPLLYWHCSRYCTESHTSVAYLCVCARYTTTTWDGYGLLVLVENSDPMLYRYTHVCLLNCSYACPFARVFRVHLYVTPRSHQHGHKTHFLSTVLCLLWILFIKEICSNIIVVKLIKMYDGNRLSGWTRMKEKKWTQIYAYKWVSMNFSIRKLTWKNSFLVFFSIVFFESKWNIVIDDNSSVHVYFEMSTFLFTFTFTHNHKWDFIVLT